MAIVTLVVLATGCAAAFHGWKVDVGGHRLRFSASGQGSPTVVLEAGLGDSLEVWNWVRREIAAETRVVVYDRAGLGRSDPGPQPRSSGQIVGELRTLLRKTGIDGPYLLVGHSFGALNVLLFGARYPEQVAGILLIDPTPPEFPARERDLRSPEEQSRTATYMNLKRPACRQELAAMEISVRQVEEAGPPRGIPVVILSASREGDSPGFRQAWLEMQENLAGRLGARRHVVLEDSSHYIQFSRPERVVAAIRDMVVEIRGGAVAEN